MKIKKFETEFADMITAKATFKNEFDEEYTLYNLGNITLFFTGDETDNNVMSLFNSKFNIWSKEELNKLGKAIQEVTEA